MFRLFCISILLLFVSCGQNAKKTDRGCGKQTMPPQGFKTDVAWIVLERSCKPDGYGSGFLVDKNKGAFYSNKHVSNVFNALGRGSHKIFFNGKVYNAEIIQTPPLVDAALVRITDHFESSEFPEPAPISNKSIRVGDKVFVEGFHPHPYQIREADKEEGYEYPLVPIFRDYYNMGTRHLEKEHEVVFEKLEAIVTEINKKIKIGGQGTGMVQDVRYSSNFYVEIKTLKDHKFSFGGLSGTVVRNIKGETVGVFTAGPTEEHEPVQDIDEHFVILKRVSKTAYIIPIKEIENLRQYLK